MQLFFIPDISGDTFTMNEQESKHCIRVLRKKAGDIFHFTNGKGTLGKVEIIVPDQRACELKVLEKSEGYGKRNFRLHIGIAPTKNIDRLEWFIEKAVEIGIDEISLLLCKHSERKKVKIERLEKIVISAMKQSVKAYKPVLNDMANFKDFVYQSNSKLQYIAHCNEDNLPALKNQYKPGVDSLILIGPEGDFTPDEVSTATDSGFSSISLGESRLRTETAGLVACHSINFLNG